MTPPDLSNCPVHLGLGAKAVIEPQFPPGEGAMAWYADYAARHADDGAEGRLVSAYHFTQNWDMWEMHPDGAEVVICTGGRITLVQEIDGAETVTTLSAGQYAINPPGVWHTADVAGECSAIFITAGMGTQHRPR